MKHHTLKNFALLSPALGVWLLASCGPGTRGGEGIRVTDTISEEKFALMLEHGKRVSYQRGMDQRSGFYMNNASVEDLGAFSVEFQAGSPWVEWALWNPADQSGVGAEKLRDEALAVVDRFQDQLGVSANELKPSDVPVVDVSGKIMALSFERFVNDVRLRDAYVQVFFFRGDDDLYYLREIVNRSGGQVQPSNEGKAAPTLANLHEITGRDDLVPVNEIPLIVASEDGNGGIEALMATEFIVDDVVQDDRYSITVAHGDGRVLEAYSHKFSADRVAVQSQVYDRTYLDGALTEKTLPLANLTVSGTSATSDLDGSIAADLKGAGTATLRSTRVLVSNSGSNTPLTIPVTVDAEAKTNAADENQLRAVNTYVATHRINKFVRQQVNVQEVPFLESVTPVRINVSGSCNAYYTGQDGSINLFAAGNGCANLALVNDVLYHEWGHALDDNMGRQVGITDGAFSEGIGDILSAYYTSSSTMAPGFFLNSNRGIRQLQNTARYPENRGEVHAEGTIIGGAFWDLRVGLIAKHGQTRGAYLAENYFLRHLLTTDAYLDSYRAVLRLDDTDGNPDTQSPNHCVINKAFAAHGLATAENCTDDPLAEVFPLDASIHVAVQSEANGDAILMASSEKAVQFGLCLGDRNSCATSGKIDVEFKLEGAAADKSRNFFVASQSMPLTDLALITGIAKDADGKVIGARTMKIVSK